MRNIYKIRSLKEEIANSMTQVFGLGLSLEAVSILVVLAILKGTVWHIVSFSIYGTTLIILYLVSSLYHLARKRRTRHIFRIMDHSSIYLLIAGTYTPFTLVTLRGPWGWSLFGLIWGLALLGIYFKLFFTKRISKFSTSIYMAIGWLPVIAIKPLLAVLPLGGFLWIIAGGLSYSVGVLFFRLEKIPYFHLIWHLFVIGGSACHFIAILFYVLPK